MSETLSVISFEQYLEEEHRSDARHEFVEGRIYPQAGGTQRHDLIAGLLYEALTPGRGPRAASPS